MDWGWSEQTVGCWGFTSWQHQRSHQDGYWLVTVRALGDFIVLPHWENRFDILPVTLSWHWANQSFLCPILIMLSSRLGIAKSLVWLDHELNSWSAACKACALPIRSPHSVLKEKEIFCIVWPMWRLTTEQWIVGSCSTRGGNSTNHFRIVNGITVWNLGDFLLPIHQTTFMTYCI